MMRGWTFTERGTPSEVLRLRDDLTKPVAVDLEPAEVLVKITDVGVFQGFAAIMAILPHFNGKFWIPGSDFSGVIDAVGSAVQNVKIGDAVFGSPDPKAYPRWGNRHNGVFVEYAIFPSSQVVRKPEHVSFEETAGLAGNGCTAIQLCQIANVKKGDKVLITAASGGLGTVTVQVARAVMGDEGTIIGTCSSANAELVKGLGADEIIDYRSHQDLSDYLGSQSNTNQFDAIIDIAGADDALYPRSPAYLKKDGIFVSAGKMDVTHGGGGVFAILAFLIRHRMRASWPLILGGTPRQARFLSGNVNGETMQKVAQLVEAGQLRGVVDSVVPMEGAVQAFERVATRRARGKIIVHVQDV